MLLKSALYYLVLLQPISAKKKCLRANLVLSANKMQASYSRTNYPEHAYHCKDQSLQRCNLSEFYGKEWEGTVLTIR